jgi:hypothetical protein
VKLAAACPATVLRGAAVFKKQFLLPKSYDMELHLAPAEFHSSIQSFAQVRAFLTTPLSS